MYAKAKHFNGIYAMSLRIQWFVCGFHIDLNFLALLGTEGSIKTQD